MKSGSIAALTAVVALLSVVQPANAEPDTVEDPCPAATAPANMLKYTNFFDGEPAERVELAPEDRSQAQILDLVWRFEVKRSRPIVLVCTYHGEGKTKRVTLSADVTVCTLTGALNDKAEVAGASRLVCGKKE